MTDDLDTDLFELDEVSGLLERLAVASAGSADLAVFALLTAAQRVQEDSGEPDEAFAEIYRLMGLSLAAARRA